jgi:hypothetical protein
MAVDTTNHRVGRVLGFCFSRRNWDSPAPPTPTRKRVCPPPPEPGGGGEAHSPAGEEVGGPTSNEGIATVVL